MRRKCLSLKEEDEGLHTDDLPAGPMIEETHSYKLSPLGPALQFVGGSNEISASSFCMRFAAELIDPPFDMIAEVCSPTTSRGSVPSGSGHRGDLFKNFSKTASPPHSQLVGRFRKMVQNARLMLNCRVSNYGLDSDYSPYWKPLILRPKL